MNGDLMYEMARQYMAEQERIAARYRLARSAAPERRGWIAAWRARRARPATAMPAVPPIPDYAHELLAASAGDLVPAPRQEDARGGHARSGR